MDNIFLYSAGALGATVAVVHGYLGEVLVVRPIDAPSPTVKRVMRAIMFLSAVYWFCASVALFLAPEIRSAAVRDTTICIVIAVFLSGSAGNLWATHGRHPGWILLAIAAILAFLGM